MKSNLYVVSCDWFAIQCESDWGVPTTRKAKGHASVSSAQNTPHGVRNQWPGDDWSQRDYLHTTYQYGTEVFTCARSVEFHPLFADSLLLQWRCRPLLHLFFTPKRADANPLSCHAKVANSALYSSQWPTLLRTALRAIGWRFVRITRVDICADFEFFANGRLPLTFCQDYLSKPTASRPSFLRKSSNKLRCNVTKTNRELLWETLSWGSRDSAVQVNLYNKTAELLHKADKSYIREKWASYGLPSDITKPVSRWVWRVEFSVNPGRTFVRSAIAKRCREIQLSDVATQRALEDFFISLLPDYFQFYYLTVDDRNRGRKVKDLKPVCLFDVREMAPYKLRTYVYTRVSGRTERLLMSRIQALIDSCECDADELRGLRLAYAKLESEFMVKHAQGVGELTPDDLLVGFLRHLSPARASSVWLSPSQKHRELLRFVGMLSRVHDDSFDRFSAAYHDVDKLLCAMDDEIKQIADGLPDWWFDDTEDMPVS